MSRIKRFAIRLTETEVAVIREGLGTFQPWDHDEEDARDDLLEALPEWVSKRHGKETASE